MKHQMHKHDPVFSSTLKQKQKETKHVVYNKDVSYYKSKVHVEHRSTSDKFTARKDI